MKKIFLLDDKSSLIPEIGQWISSCGYEVLEAHKKKEWRKLISSNPDLILLPVDSKKISWKENLSMSLKEIKDKTIPILGFTSVGEKNWREKKKEAVQAGCNTIISIASLENNSCWQLALYTRPLDFTMAKKPLPLGIKKGIELFNEGKFHEAHDEIEPIWLEEKRDFRMLYQGILQIGIAFYQIEHRKFDVALRMFTCGKLKIRHFLPKFQGIDVKKLYLDSEKAEKVLKKLGPKKISSFDKKLFPKIQFNS